MHWRNKPVDFLAVRLLNWDEIIYEDDNDENWADPGVLSGSRNHHGRGHDNDNGEGMEDMQGGEKGTGKWKGIMHGQGTRKGTDNWNGKGSGKGKSMEGAKGKGNGNGKGKSIVKETTGGDDICRAVDVQLQMELSEADSDTEG